MQILDILNQPWAIQSTVLDEIQQIYVARARGDAVDLAAFQKARTSAAADQNRKPYQVIDGVAVLPIEGVIGKKFNLFTQICGGTSTQLASTHLSMALADSTVHSIIQYVDSPGGTVDGTQTYANDVFAARSTKPIVTLASGLMASAGYWIGAAAGRVYITDSTTRVGSIGVVAKHLDVSAQESARGIKTTEITSGKYKRIASEFAPLTEEGRQSIQDTTDYLYSIFVNAVATYRGVTAEQVLSNMADGRIFIGQQAIDAGLVDGVISLPQLIQQLNQERKGSVTTTGARMDNPSAPAAITKEQIEKDHPHLAAAFRQEGASAERERIQSVQAQAIPGHEALINSMMFDGKSNGGDAAMAVLAAERTARNAAAAANRADAPQPVAQTPQSNDDAHASSEGESKEALAAKAKAYAKEHGVSFVAAYKAVGGK